MQDGSGKYKRGLRAPRERRQITVRLSRELIDFAEREAYLRSARPPYSDVTMSDVIRIALESLRDTSPSMPYVAPPPCRIASVGDHNMCAVCGLTWIGDDKPECNERQK